jgi:uncharacterized protein YggU (UPF0235/DUF167 family)
MRYSVEVVSDARKERVETTPKGIRVSVKEEAKAGKANSRVKQLLALHFKVPVREVKIVTGMKRPKKLIHINH